MLFKPGMWTRTLDHFNNYYTNAPRLSFKSPMASFGSRVGGSPLYYGQSYSFGVYAGDPSNGLADAIAIEVYDKSTLNLVATHNLPIPSVSVPGEWARFLTNGYSVATNAYGLNTVLSFSDSRAFWASTTNGCFHLTHTATQTNYFYLVQLKGKVANTDMVQSSGTNSWSRLYTMEFENRPPWRSVFIDQPHFDTLPMPSAYQGKTVDELLALRVPLTNSISLTPSSCMNLDQSPELRQHPILDQFVKDMRADPIALANYVLNEIELTDAIAYNDAGYVSEQSINLGGVNRSALATFLEGQGSPTEQCALLIYLLRRAGYPATYVYPPHNGMLMLDKQMSRLLRMRVNGLVDDYGNSNIPELIPVNYPWVALYVSTNGVTTNWVHVFPWLKDTEIVEGLNLYDHMPTNYNNGYKWIKAYVMGDTNILSLDPEVSTPVPLLKKFITATLQQNYPGISLDDIGVRTFNRRHSYYRWSDFPTPFSVTNIITAVESLGSSSVTNVAPSMTNIFDTVSVEVFSKSNPATKISTGPMRMVDLHNRRFLVYHQTISSTQHRMILSLAPYRPDATNRILLSTVGFMGTDTNIIQNLTMTNTLGSGDDILTLNFTNTRHRAISPASVSGLGAWDTFLGVSELLSVGTQLFMRKGDLAGICLNAGRVSQKMLDIHAQEFWQMERTLQLTPSATNSLSVEVYQGIPAYLMGMSYDQLCDRSQRLINDLHKVQTLTVTGVGLGEICAKRSGGVLPANGDLIMIAPKLDMVSHLTAIVGNNTLRPDEGDDLLQALRDSAYVAAAERSAQEHKALDTFYGETNAVSTVALLQIAQAATNSGGPGILMLNKNNYLNYGTSNFNGTLLKDYDPGVWRDVTNTFVNGGVDVVANGSGDFVQAFLTPGSFTNKSGSYKGVAAFIVDGFGSAEAAIGENKNGGWASLLFDWAFGLANSPSLTLEATFDGNYQIEIGSPSPSNLIMADDSFLASDTLTDIDDARSGNTPLNDTQKDAATQSSLVSGETLSTDGENRANQLETIATKGQLVPNNPRSWWQMVLDPVNIVTGEFYVDATDLSLAGPMPLQVRRNYSSRNLGPNQFGWGWKLNYMPYLELSVDTNLILAAEPDGLVMVYSRIGTNDLWRPSKENNPHWNNRSREGIGSTANMFNGSIQKTNSGGTVIYTLSGPDGGVRTFQVMNFTDVMTNARPYLTKWQDNHGNYCTLEYGTNSAKSDFSQARRVQCSNGGFLCFNFDPFGHIVEAYTGDGRRLQYEYDTFSDLVKVILADSSELEFEYEHRTMSITNGSTVTQTPYSTHLLTKEIKPDGRLLVNFYDSQRRVTNQLSTVGADLTPIRNGTFVYSNNFLCTNSFTNSISGYTWVKDVFNNTTFYSYTNDLLTIITDPLGQSIVQDWYEPSETNKVGYYQRSLEKLTDKRGLITTYQYDTNGNPTNVTVKGDILGDGNTNTSAATYSYDANNLLIASIDASGRTNKYFYTNGWLLSRTETYPLNTQASGAITNAFVYCSVTNAADSTLASFGLLKAAFRAIGSSDAASNSWGFDYRGFITNATIFTGTADPNVISAFVYNNRNELIEQSDALGRRARFDYDALGRPRSKEIYEPNQAVPLAWDYSYYNPNGELVWSDGPRYDPEDYVWRDYDGAGRKTQEIRWRSRAKSDGSGVEPEIGDNLYATSFFYYDGFGNLTNVTDPVGNYIWKQYDSIGQMTNEIAYGSNGFALRTNQYRYEPGGLVATNINSLGGLTIGKYTSAGKPESQTNPDGSTNAWRYYVDGRIQKEILSNGSYWETTYDDANRKTVRTFKNSGGTVLATTTNVFDRRGNQISRTDEEGYTFTTTYDGLDRVKVSTGPPAVYAPQQKGTNYYDAAGQSVTNVNTLGEKTITVKDALGRPVSVVINSSADVLVRQTTYNYSPNHHSVTMTDGSGAGAISSTVFTDTYNKTVLGLHYPTAGTTNFSLSSYDVVGDLLTNRDELGQTTTFTYDSLNRASSQTLPDGAVVNFGYNAAGSLTNRAMPGGLTWSATYDSANRKTSELLNGGGLSRTTSFAYYTSGATVGLLKDVTDARGVTAHNSYDDFLRVSQVDYSGPLADQNHSETFGYDKRGLVTYAYQFNDNQPVIEQTVSRLFDGNRQLITEILSLDGGSDHQLNLSWDSAGRRAGLSMGSVTAGQGLGSGTNRTFGYRADGAMTSLTSAGLTFNFSYGDNGLLTNRSNAFRTQIISQRDGRGHIKQITNMVGSTAALIETFNWRANSTVDDYTATRLGSPAELRDYIYNPRGQLTNETFATASNGLVTNRYSFDSSKLGVLTDAVQSGALSNRWDSGALDGFMRVQYETNIANRLSVRAAGSAFGAASVTASLDGSTVNNLSFSSTSADGRWYADLDLASGNHSLIATAHHPLGTYHPNATNNFSAVGTNLVTSSYDAAGNLTNRVFTGGRTQSLTWDGEGRLVTVTETVGSTNVYTWTALYDALGRRTRTITTSVSGTNTVSETIDSWYDPHVEFLEVAVLVNGERTWKVYGPDVSGHYGGAQGIGGLEATIKERDGTTTGIINDYYGNAVATVSSGTINWNGTKLTGYGPAKGYKPPILSASVPVSEATLWQDRMMDLTGFYYLGARYYDSEAGRFMSPDPRGHVASMDLYSYANGDPVNGLDSDGRLATSFVAGVANLGQAVTDGAVAIGHIPFVVVGAAGNLLAHIPLLGPTVGGSLQLVSAAGDFSLALLGQAGSSAVQLSSGLANASIGSVLFDGKTQSLGFQQLGAGLSATVDLAGKGWTSPNTAIGLALGIAGMTMGATPSFGHNGIQFSDNPLMFRAGAITFGNAMNFGAPYTDAQGNVFPMGPDDPLFRGTSWTFGDHEMQHTYQAQLLGPLFLPAYGVGMIGAIFNPIYSGGPFGPSNFMERGPSLPDTTQMQRQPQPWP